MSIFINFKLETKNPEKVFDVAQKYTEVKGYEFCSEGNYDSVEIVFCRMGNMYITKEKKGLLGKTTFAGEIQTNVAGPGLHHAATEWIDYIAANAPCTITVEDEIDYYRNRDFSEMKKENFNKWLETIVDFCVEKKDDSQYDRLCISWDMGKYIPAKHAGSMISPFGRYNIDALAKQVDEQGIEKFARDYFLWYEKEKDAYFYRNTALNMLWEDCYFVDSDKAEDAEYINGEIISNLEKAYKMNPRIPFPVKEYLEICSLHNHKPVNLEDAVDLQTEYPIGYRKENVTIKIGRISFVMPGNFIYEDGEDGAVWYSTDDDWRNFRISVYNINGSMDFLEELFEDADGNYEDFVIEGGRCRAAFEGETDEGDGEKFFTTRAQVIGEGTTAIITASHKTSDYQWAMELFRQITICD